MKISSSFTVNFTARRRHRCRVPLSLHVVTEVLDVSSNKMTGTVKFFDTKKSFGFITSDDITGDLFVHYRSIMMEGFKNLREGQQVSFTAVRSDKGWQAHEVIPLESEVSASSCTNPSA